MTAILAIETATLTASVALLRDGKIAFERSSGVNSHSQILLELIDEGLRTCDLALADLNTIAIGAGPGSFTGLRIGMATAKGLCFAAGVSMTPVSSLAALALDCANHHPADAIYLPVMDARRKEIFAGFFEREGDEFTSLTNERVMAPAQLAAHALEVAQGRPLILSGDGATKYRELVAPIGQVVDDAPQTPTARSVALLAQHLPPIDVLATAAPTYVRLSEAEIKFPNGNPGGTFATPRKA